MNRIFVVPSRIQGFRGSARDGIWLNTFLGFEVRLVEEAIIASMGSVEEPRGSF